MGGLFKQFGQAWRSVASVILAYGIIVLLFFYNENALSWLFDFASDSHEGMKDLAGSISKRGEFLFGFMISEGSVFLTLMFLFARIVVLSIILWISSLIVDGIFGKARAES